MINLWNNRYILDGAFGTRLQAYGMPAGVDSAEFSMQNPDIVERIHREYVEAGSDIIFAPTFSAHKMLLQAERDNGAQQNCDIASIVQSLTAPAFRVRDDARKGIGTPDGKPKDIYVALDLGPIGELLEPMGKLTFEEAYEVYAEVMKQGAACGVDAIWLETMTDLYEVKAGVLAARENTGLPLAVTMSFEKDGRTFTGTGLREMATTLNGLDVDAMGINCSLGPIEILPLIKELANYTDLPLIAKPNAGLPDPATGGYSIDCSRFVDCMAEYAGAGVAHMGGCCGTTPEYIRGIAALKCSHGDGSGGNNVPTGTVPVGPTVCSATKSVTIDHVTVVGERLNPTGKKKLKQALIDEDYEYILQQAKKQIDAGAEVLDVNVGVPGLDEAKLMPKLVKKLQSVVSVPLQIDSSNPEVIEAALRVYNGKAIVNSVNGEEEKLRAILPIVKKYGAVVIGLTLDDTGIPETAEQRFAIAERIINHAMAIGISKEDLIIDCLTLTVSAQQKEVNETLKTVRMVTEKMGLPTALGVSNVSFGLPMRPVINRTFLTMAMENGLKLPIINPNDEDMMASIYAFNVLKNNDIGASEYIDRYAEKPAEQEAKSDLLKAILDGMDCQAAKCVREMLFSMDAMTIVNEHLIPALDVVGKSYEKGDTFLPQMMQSAVAAQAGFDVLREKMKSSNEQKVTKGDVVIATVKGDIHDIGKNIVRVIMENYGFNMIDLGRDVDPQAVVDAVKKNNVRLVGLSALMTTTLAGMEETIKAVRAAAPDCKVMVGGAVLTADYAAEIGADYYCADAMKSVEAAQEVFG